MSVARPLHVFVVDDDVELRDLLCRYLGRHGFDTTPMGTAEEFMRRMHRLRPDLVLLDVELPQMSGLQACQKLRVEGDRVPIILLTCHAEEIDRVIGLEMGADDYVSKPYSARELLARIRAVLRRSRFTPGEPVRANACVRIGEYVFMVASRSLHKGHEVRVLNTVEYAMLAELTTNAGVTVSRERLMAVSHTCKDVAALRSVDAAMVRLRRVVEPDPSAPRYIQTVRGHGYIFLPADVRVTP